MHSTTYEATLRIACNLNTLFIGFDSWKSLGKCSRFVFDSGGLVL